MNGELCPYCGELEDFDFLEIWPEDRAFMLTACCEESEQAMRDWLECEATDAELVEFLNACGFEDYTGKRLRSIVRDELESTGLGLDCCLTLCDVTLAEAKQFVRDHHEHNAPPVSWKFGYGVRNFGELIGVAMAGRPVARMIDHRQVLEVNRVCIKRMLPAAIRKDACSMLYGACAREAKRRGLSRVITYTLESELGTACKAAGFKPVAKTRGGSWNRPSRARVDTAPTVRKVRWEREVA